MAWLSELNHDLAFNTGLGSSNNKIVCICNGISPFLVHWDSSVLVLYNTNPKKIKTCFQNAASMAFSRSFPGVPHLFNHFMGTFTRFWAPPRPRKAPAFFPGLCRCYWWWTVCCIGARVGGSGRFWSFSRNKNDWNRWIMCIYIYTYCAVYIYYIYIYICIYINIWGVTV